MSTYTIRETLCLQIQHRYVCVCTCEYELLSLCACVCACLSTIACMRACQRTCRCTQSRACTLIYAYTHVHAHCHTHTHTCTYALTYTYTFTHTHPATSPLLRGDLGRTIPYITKIVAEDPFDKDQVRNKLHVTTYVCERNNLYVTCIQGGQDS